MGLVYDPREMLGVTTVKPGVTGVLHNISRFVKTRVFMSLAFLNHRYCCSLVHAGIG
jgi:hypothetical protein